MDIISRKLANDRLYAYHEGRFWFWDETRNLWKESHLMTQKFERAKDADKLLMPDEFLTDPVQFCALEDYEVDSVMKNALRDAKPCQTVPIEPVEKQPTGAMPVPSQQDQPAAPGFDFGADAQTNALLMQDAQTFITGNMARIMAAKHAHDICANNKNGTWGRWCEVVGISRDTGDNMVHIAEQFGNIQIDGQSIFDVRPMKLLYAAAKPSTPETVKQAVFSGDITTYKEYQAALAQIKAEKDRANAAEAREEEAWSMVSKAQAEARAKAAEEALKKQPITAVVDEEEVDRRAHQQAYGIAADMNEELRADRDKLQQDIAELNHRLAKAEAVVPADLVADRETADNCCINISGIWSMALPAFNRLIGTGEDLNDAASNLLELCDRIHAELVKMMIANDKVTQYE